MASDGVNNVEWVREERCSKKEYMTFIAKMTDLRLVDLKFADQTGKPIDGRVMLLQRWVEKAFSNLTSDHN